MNATKKHRIWAQGATDQVGHRNYLASLLPHMKACTDPDFELEFKTMTPSVTTVHALSEFRFSRAVVRGAIAAERDGYDVFFMNHFQDVGLYDARASVKIPVLGLVENMSFYECTNCRHVADIFGHGGGEQVAEQLNIPFLGRLPLYQPIRVGSDRGIPLVIAEPDSAGTRAFMDLAETTVAQLAVNAQQAIVANKGKIPLIQVK